MCTNNRDVVLFHVTSIPRKKSDRHGSKILSKEVQTYGDKKSMNAKLKRSAVVMLVLGLAASLVVGSFYLPAYAQDGAGDQLIEQVEPLTISGEGDDTVLTTNVLTLAPDERHAYRFDYDGGDQPIKVTLNSIPAGAVQFQIWTDDLVNALNDDPDLAPQAVGEPLSEGSDFSVWQGNTPSPEVYYVTVLSTADDTAQYALNITSPGLADNQPGTVPRSAHTDTCHPISDTNGYLADTWADSNGDPNSTCPYANTAPKCHSGCGGPTSD
jgi:hypothetical protein